MRLSLDLLFLSSSSLLLGETSIAFAPRPVSFSRPAAHATRSRRQHHSRRSSTSLRVSIGLGPDEKEKTEGSELADGSVSAEAEVIVEPDHELFRTSRRSKLDEKCDEWYGALLGDESSPSFLGKVAKEAREKIVTPVELKDEPKLSLDHEEWTPYVHHRLPSSPILPAYGLEQFGLPIPRRNAEAWRHFDVTGLVNTDYSGTPKGMGTDLVLEEEVTAKYRSALVEKGGWIDDEQCIARLVYVNGRFCPSLSKTTGDVRNLSEKDFSSPSSLRDEIVDCLSHLTDGFSDRLAADVPDGDDGFLTSYKKLSTPDHNVGEPASQYAVNSQQGTACFVALNSVKTGAVALVDVPSHTGADVVDDVKPVLIINAKTPDGGSDEEGRGVACHPRTLAIAGEGSKLSLVQTSVDLDVDVEGDGSTSTESNAKFYNGYTQIYVGKDANVTHSYLEETGGMVVAGVESSDDEVEKSDDATLPRELEAQRPALRDTHFEMIDVHVTGDDGSYSGTMMEIGGCGRSRIAMSTSLLRPGAHATVNGFCLSGGAQRADMRTNIHHIAQGTSSRQSQKNMVGGRSTAAFRGRIRVEQSAQQTDSEQLSRTILLSDNSRIWATPSLEIIADDVKCTHGATVSDLSEEELFYLRSRGIDRTTARNILMYAFVDEVGQAVDPAIMGNDDDEKGLKKRVIQRLENVVPQGDRAIKGEFQSV